MNGAMGIRRATRFAISTRGAEPVCTGRGLTDQPFTAQVGLVLAVPSKQPGAKRRLAGMAQTGVQGLTSVT